MRFFEYEAKEIVRRAGIPTSKGGFAKTREEARQRAEEIDGPVVIKSQVLTGGRMKAGGVKFADAELIGVPKIVIAGRGVAEGVVEVWDRASGDRVTVPIDGVVAALG